MLIPIEKGSDNPILRTPSKPLKEITKKTLKLVKDMEETMHSVRGVGLAAPQIGLNDRLFIMTLNGGSILPVVNPEILEISEERELGEEGCLSLPGYWGKVPRAKALTMKFTTLKGQDVTMKFQNFEAREVQHELDHLNAKLFIDHLTPKEITFDEKMKRVNEGEDED